MDATWFRSSTLLYNNRIRNENISKKICVLKRRKFTLEFHNFDFYRSARKRKHATTPGTHPSVKHRLEIDLLTALVERQLSEVTARRASPSFSWNFDRVRHLKSNQQETLAKLIRQPFASRLWQHHYEQTTRNALEEERTHRLPSWVVVVK